MDRIYLAHIEQEFNAGAAYHSITLKFEWVGRRAGDALEALSIV